MSNEYKLKEEIIALSESKVWTQAKLEWELDYIYFEDEPETCLCGKTPIIEVCVLKNRRNGNNATVGNVCVKKFIGLPSNNIFQAVKRISEDIEKSLNLETINYAHNRKWISEKDFNFYSDIWRKQKLSPKQMNWKVKINQRILSKIRAARRLAEIAEMFKQPFQTSE